MKRRDVVKRRGVFCPRRKGVLSATLSAKIDLQDARPHGKDDGNTTGQECQYVSYYYYPEVGKIYLLNVDFDHPHSVQVHHFATNKTVILNPGEFRVLDTVFQKPSTLNR